MRLLGLCHYGGVQKLPWTHLSMEQPSRYVGRPQPASKDAEKVKVAITTYFHFATAKPEMDHSCNYHSLNVGDPAEAGNGLAHTTIVISDTAVPMERQANEPRNRRVGKVSGGCPGSRDV